ncbi:MAG: (Fe-S)-binding protein [Clostridiales bacterium]|nr:(Fe-S)-binding protein [Clostridiales bacterium]MDU1028187.1 (Fe-S)-binding protein [Clostridiales bacterium]MDU2293721.1 (Fe-S)-binding protein [Peptococcus niger]MDU5951614.1 (Fe-S)-binding protein [Clostridiales bacterium]
MKIHLFTQCMVDMFYPQVGIAAVEVLERLGCDIVVPEKQACCGQPMINSGYVQASKAAMKNTISAFEDAEYIVSLSGSCAFAMKHEYPQLFKDEPSWQMRAAKMADKIYEFTDFIVNVLGVTDVGARLNKKVTYHKSCHATRLLGVSEEPLTLLKNVKGLEYIELDKADRCCGFGGTFSVKQPEISEQIVAEKAQYIINSGADVLCGADQACLMNIAGRLDRMKDMGQMPHPVKVMHIAEVLNCR